MFGNIWRYGYWSCRIFMRKHRVNKSNSNSSRARKGQIFISDLGGGIEDLRHSFLFFTTF